MKIISKYKDYYDYLVGIYGIDEHLIYDRRKKIVRFTNYGNSYTRYKFAICNKLYYLFYYKNNFYFYPGELKELFKLLIKANISIDVTDMIVHWYDITEKQITSKFCKKVFAKNKEVTNINKKFREPLLIYNTSSKIWQVPILKTFKMARILPAESLYQDISLFLGWLKDYPEKDNTQTDTDKLLSHGFDKKKSFRHRK